MSRKPSNAVDRIEKGIDVNTDSLPADILIGGG